MYGCTIPQAGRECRSYTLTALLVAEIQGVHVRLHSTAGWKRARQLHDDCAAGGRDKGLVCTTAQYSRLEEKMTALLVAGIHRVHIRLFSTAGWKRGSQLHDDCASAGRDTGGTCTTAQYSRLEEYTMTALLVAGIMEVRVRLQSKATQ